MPSSDNIFFFVVAMLAINIFIARLPRWEERIRVFWTVQVLNLGCGILMLAEGVQDFPWIVNWMVGFLFLYHIIDNNRRLQNARRRIIRQEFDRQQAEREEELARLQQDDQS